MFIHHLWMDKELPQIDVNLLLYFRICFSKPETSVIIRTASFQTTESYWLQLKTESTISSTCIAARSLLTSTQYQRCIIRTSPTTTEVTLYVGIERNCGFKKSTLQTTDMQYSGSMDHSGIFTNTPLLLWYVVYGGFFGKPGCFIVSQTSKIFLQI